MNLLRSSMTSEPCQLGLDFVGKSSRQRDDRERGVGETRGRKNRASGYVKVGDSMNLAVGVHHASAGVRMHSRATHMMMPQGQASGSEIRRIGGMSFEIVAQALHSP